jgi:hypothetical protein
MRREPLLRPQKIMALSKNSWIALWVDQNCRPDVADSDANRVRKQPLKPDLHVLIRHESK